MVNIFQQVRAFNILSAIICKEWEIEESVNHGIRSKWMKWSSTPGYCEILKYIYEVKGKKFIRHKISYAIWY